ncbi:hypothetical protein SVIOM342S_08234 [Streptomyces violaceorubidus]
MRFLVYDRLLGIGDDYWIEDDRGNKVFLVDGKAMRLREHLELKDAQGRVLIDIHQKMFALRDTMVIERVGEPLARIKRKRLSLLRNHYRVTLADGTELDVSGKILDREFAIEYDGELLAVISRRWLTLRDTYGVDVVRDDADPALLIATGACDPPGGEGAGGRREGRRPSATDRRRPGRASRPAADGAAEQQRHDQVVHRRGQRPAHPAGPAPEVHIRRPDQPRVVDGHDVAGGQRRGAGLHGDPVRPVLHGAPADHVPRGDPRSQAQPEDADQPARSRVRSSTGVSSKVTRAHSSAVRRGSPDSGSANAEAKWAPSDGTRTRRMSGVPVDAMRGV